MEYRANFYRAMHAAGWIPVIGAPIAVGRSACYLTGKYVTHGYNAQDHDNEPFNQLYLQLIVGALIVASIA